ncbi:MAG: amidohydrolase family protein [Chloroflexi bacterium]|nr:amidohydrolase family protein [Chloroflexota bacterium]
MPNTLVLGQMLWADTTQPPQPGWGVAVADGRVLAAAPHDDLRARFPGAAVVDAGGCVITPSLVNAHHHMYGGLAHGIPIPAPPPGDNETAEGWSFLSDFWWPRVEDRLTHDLIAAATDWACLEMVRSGVTTFYDCLEAPNALPGCLDMEAQVVRRWGLRGALSFEATERAGTAIGELGLQENATFIDECQARGGLVNGMMCLHTTFTCSAAFIRRAFALADARGAITHMHLSESAYEPAYCLARFGARPVAYYEQLGVLDAPTLASQCVQVDAAEVDILARRGVHVSHQPISNCEVGGGFAPVPEMLAAGVNVALGTDGYVNNLFEVMRAAALIPRARLQDPGAMPAHIAWTMATQNGARALGFADLGTLAPSHQADLLLIAADLPTPLTVSNLADQLLLWRDPAHLRGVMCAGRWLLRDGKVLGVDEEAIRARVQQAAQTLWHS